LISREIQTDALLALMRHWAAARCLHFYQDK